jgi:recombination protein RecA
MAKKTNINGSSTALANLKGFRLGGRREVDNTVPCGYTALDIAISDGLVKEYANLKEHGFPLANIAVLYGAEGSGKSSIAYRICGSAQRKGWNCAWIDAENSYSTSLAKINGVDTEKLLVASVADFAKGSKDEICAEMLLDNALEAVKSGGIKVLVIDSVASLVSRRQLEASSVGDEFIGELARVLSRFLPKLRAAAQEAQVLVVLINQLRKKVGERSWIPGSDETMPGGHSLRHNADIILKMEKCMGKKRKIMMRDEEGKERMIGRESMITVEKTRNSRPIESALSVPIYFEHYFPDIDEIAFDVGRYLKVIRARMNVFSWNDLKCEGKEPFIALLKKEGNLEKLIGDIVDESKKEDYIIPFELLVWNRAEHEEMSKNIFIANED